tara:strand:- start:118141 stop:120339 length:2199 start_codon:yes stop_codon:yes gene_type:complete
MDSGLQALALVAQLHQVALDDQQLCHQFARDDRACSPNELVLAARRVGLKAKRIHSSGRSIDDRVLPAIGIARNGDAFVFARAASTEQKPPCFLVQTSFPGKPQRIDEAALELLWGGDLILVRPQGSANAGIVRRFNLHWFVPALVRYRRLFAQVLIASFFLQLFALVTPLFFQVVMDKVLVHRGFTTLNVLAFGFVIVVAFDAIIGGLRNYLFSHTTTRVDVELGARLFRHLASLPLSYFEVRQVGQTVARVRELETIRNFITGTALTLLIDLSFTFVFFAVLWYYSPTLTWIVLGSLPFYIVLSLVITPVLRTRLDEKFNYGAANQAFLTESVTGIQTVKSQALEPQMQRKWEGQLASYVRANFRAQNLNNVANQVAGFISKITTLLIIWWGAHLVIGGLLTVGQLVAFNMIAGRVTAPVLKLVQLWQDFQQAGISLARLGDILNTPVEPGFNSTRSAPGRLKGAVSFESVKFRYQADSAPAIDTLSLALEPGEIVGLVGRSGSGKSTLAKLLLRLYVPESGRILVDGSDLAMVDTAWLRSNAGVVQQESFLFNRSVRDNIALANPGLSFERVVECATASGAHEFIQDLPQGYDTIVGEQGSNLSGGQRQRLAIARALMSDPRILILDEATSALDYESERIVQENMGAISQGRTVLIIAHRLSTVRHCDRIVVMDKGQLIEQGGHESLLRSNGYYAKLCGYQNEIPAIRSCASSSRSHIAADAAPFPGGA